MSVTAKIVPDRAGDNIARAGRMTPAMAKATVSKVMHTARTEVVKRTSVGWSGALRGGYDVEVKTTARGVSGRLVNPILYHDIVEDGRRPGRMPPVAALVPWVGSKLGIPPGPQREAVAFLVARKIGRVGFEGQHMVEEGWNEAKRQVSPELKKLGLRIVRVMGGKA